jgi:hypothetical protein
MTIPSENRRTGKAAHVPAPAPHQHKKHGGGHHGKQDARERAFGGNGRNHRNNNRHRGQHEHRQENRNGGGPQRPQHANGSPGGQPRPAHHGAPAGTPKGEPTAIENVTFMREPRRQAGHRAPR